MEVINRLDTMEESADENIMHDGIVDHNYTDVGAVMEETEVVDCEADVEADVVEADDDNIQYHLYAVNRSDSTVAYKVMHVSDSHRESNEFSIATPMNNVQVLAPLNGPLYLLSNASDVVTSEPARNVAPRVAKLQIEGAQSVVTGIKKRDERRRVTHNEVERRRRDKINNWISKLGKLLPECEQSTEGEGDTKVNFESQSKGGILARACEYISELRENKEKLAQSLDENAQLMEEAKNLRQVVNDLKNENSKLKAKISENNVLILST